MTFERSKKQVLKSETVLLGSEAGEGRREWQKVGQGRMHSEYCKLSFTGEFPDFDLEFPAPFNFINSQEKWFVLKLWQADQGDEDNKRESGGYLIGREGT